MNTTQLDDLYRSDDRSALRRVAGGWLAEAVGSLAAVLCSLAGLAGPSARTMAGSAILIIGASILIEGGAFASGFAGLVSIYRQEGRALEWGGVIVAEFVGGLTAILLGVLALLGITPPTLLAVAVLVLGATFLFSSIVSLQSGLQALGGLAAFALGLLAVSGLRPLTLILLALLGLGLVGLASGAATGRRIRQTARTQLR